MILYRPCNALKHYEALVALPDGIQAKAKLQRLATMAPQDILSAFAAHQGDHA